MRFTEEHITLLEKYMHIWECLRDAHYVRNLDAPILDDLQRIHNEALSVYHFNLWCNSCVAEMIRIVYVNYEQFKIARNVHKTEPEQAGGDKHDKRNKSAQG